MPKLMSTKQIERLNIVVNEKLSQMTTNNAIYETIYSAGLTVEIDDFDNLLCSNDKGKLVNVCLEEIDGQIFNDFIELHENI